MYLRITDHSDGIEVLIVLICVVRIEMKLEMSYTLDILSKEDICYSFDLIVSLKGTYLLELFSKIKQIFN